ncbi:Uncharacterized protein DAT39_022496 [Clarias magur]|uniref:Uncharacterized protein n=1 Tax=Clarias magur TaxID=1594786 RepID=A0A8J4T2Z9_CLAMG|nr:Uncharacterized protein DAT39_022496 [Clarias magur]
MFNASLLVYWILKRREDTQPSLEMCRAEHERSGATSPSSACRPLNPRAEQRRCHAFLSFPGKFSSNLTETVNLAHATHRERVPEPCADAYVRMTDSWE